MLSRIFIDRPIFAWVIAIIIMLAGAGSIFSLPVEQYPDIAPPNVNIRANFPGASAQTLENSVTQVIEQQLTGIDGLLYFTSNSTSRGQVTITATFDKGVDPDTAQVQVQNKVQQALPRLPQQVQQQGLVVTKSNPDFLLIAAVYDTTDRMTNQDVSDYLVSNFQDAIGRIPGVGDTNVFGAQYAMRIWLDPQKLASYQLMPSDVTSAIQAQNTEVAAGEIGAQPMPQGQMLDATVTAQSRLQTPQQFRDIILKTQPDGSMVRLSDVARVELGAENYQIISRINGHPGAGVAVSLAPGADALSTAELVKAEIEQRARDFPPGLEYTFPSDTTGFIKLSVEEVAKTLVEAIVLVVLVIFIFLQGWRPTLVPAIAVPVVLLGTFAVLNIAGFSINTLTLFGLVLVVGLLVDDAIVVVENVERLLEENPGMSPREATIRSMGEIQMALIAIAMVLSAVFLPMAFFGGSTGVIYRQFSITIVSAMVLSVIVALVLSPAITANLLKSKQYEATHESLLSRRLPRVSARLGAAAAGFNRGFARLVEMHQNATRYVTDRKWLFLAIYGAITLLLVIMFFRLPTRCLPAPHRAGRSRRSRRWSAISSIRSGAMSRRCSRSAARPAAVRAAARMSGAASSISSHGTSATAAKTAPMRSPGGRAAPCLACGMSNSLRPCRRRSAAWASRTASRWSSRTAAASPTSSSRRRAIGCSRWRAAIPASPPSACRALRTCRRSMSPGTRRRCTRSASTRPTSTTRSPPPGAAAMSTISWIAAG